jgi:hypothetical protein
MMKYGTQELVLIKVTKYCYAIKRLAIYKKKIGHMVLIANFPASDIWCELAALDFSSEIWF